MRPEVGAVAHRYGGVPEDCDTFFVKIRNIYEGALKLKGERQLVLAQAGGLSGVLTSGFLLSIAPQRIHVLHFGESDAPPVGLPHGSPEALGRNLTIKRVRDALHDAPFDADPVADLVLLFRLDQLVAKESGPALLELHRHEDLATPCRLTPEAARLSRDHPGEVVQQRLLAWTRSPAWTVGSGDTLLVRP